MGLRSCFVLVIPAHEQLGLVADVIVEAHARFPAILRRSQEVLEVRAGGIGCRIRVRLGVGAGIDQRVGIQHGLRDHAAGEAQVAATVLVVAAGHHGRLAVSRREARTQAGQIGRAEVAL